MSFRFGRDVLPLLLAGGAMAGAKMFSNGSNISEADQARNDQIWDRLGRGASASPSAMGPEMPGKNPLAGSAPIHSADAVNRAFPMQEPMAGYNLPGHIAGGPLMAQFPMLQQPNQPQAPMVAQPAPGLLGAPNEASQQAFLKGQGVGASAPPPAQVAPVVAGGSSTNQTNPFLYAMLYNNDRKVM